MGQNCPLDFWKNPSVLLRFFFLAEVSFCLYKKKGNFKTIFKISLHVSSKMLTCFRVHVSSKKVSLTCKQIFKTCKRRL